MPVFDRSDFYIGAWGHITSGFGFRPKFNRVHKGVDISLSVGDTVRAALPGIVGQVNYGLEDTATTLSWHTATALKHATPTSASRLYIPPAD